MKVYIVATGLAQEGDDVEGVFSTRTLAEQYIYDNNLTTEPFTGARINEYVLDHKANQQVKDVHIKTTSSDY